MIDPIDRHAAIDALLEIHKNRPLDSDRWVIADCRRAILALPSINGIGEPNENDAISRGEAIAAVKTGTIEALTLYGQSNALRTAMTESVQIIAGLPSREPERKKGHWKPFDLTWGRNIYACSVCGNSCDVPTEMGKLIFDYCPNCGADMRGRSDDE